MINAAMNAEDIAAVLRGAASDYLNKVDELLHQKPDDWTEPDQWADLGATLADLLRVSLELFSASSPLEFDDDEEPDQRESGSQVVEDLERVFGAHDRYAFAMLADDDPEPVERSISDDLADIYAELLAIGRQKQLSASQCIWRWRLGYLSFWGYHALGALTACHLRALGVWDTEWRPTD